MDANELEARAQARYAADDNQVKPTWEQIGDTTKSVWRDYVLADLAKPVATIAAPAALAAAVAPAPVRSPDLAAAPAGFRIPSMSLPLGVQSVEVESQSPDELESESEPERQRECGQMGLF